jgi:hypothetical protein
MTGDIAAENSVPGAQIFEVTYAATADATALRRSVVMSTPSRGGGGGGAACAPARVGSPCEAIDLRR